MRDLFSDAINRPAGRLAEILIKKLPARAVNLLPDELRSRFDRLVSDNGNFGRLARVRIAAEVSLLFERAPEWTEKNIVPLFQWSSPDAAAVWSGRKYSNYIGSPKLISLIKKPFLELFERGDLPEEEIRVFAEWLTVIMIANQTEKADYPITPMEARSALRYAGVRGLSSVGHRLAIEMEAAKVDEKLSVWRKVVGPVFKAIWPLDVELQSAGLTFKLVQLLRATGEAFPEAASVITPFIQPEDPRGHTTVYSLSNGDDLLYTLAPDKMLNLLSAIVGDATGVRIFGLDKALERLRNQAPELVNLKKFQKLLNAANG